MDNGDDEIDVEHVTIHNGMENGDSSHLSRSIETGLASIRANISSAIAGRHWVS